MAGIYFLLIAATATAVLGYPGENEIYPIPQECPAENSKEYTVHIAHKDCTKFCKCDNGVAYVMKCPKGENGNRLHFNKVLQVCDRPAHAKCDGRGTTSGQCGGSGGGATKPTTPKPTTPKPTSAPPDCVEGDTSAHECSCEKYYLCKNGEYVLRQCKKGEHYSKKKKRCTQSSRAGCIKKKIIF